MITRKPKLTEEQFLNGAAHKKSNGSSAVAVASFRPRLPEELYQRLREVAWKRRVTANGLIIEILEAAVSRRERKDEEG